jgi:hypothetical protein
MALRMAQLGGVSLVNKPKSFLLPSFSLRAEVRASPRFRSLRFLLCGRKALRIAAGSSRKISRLGRHKPKTPGISLYITFLQFPFTSCSPKRLLKPPNDSTIRVAFDVFDRLVAPLWRTMLRLCCGSDLNSVSYLSICCGCCGSRGGGPPLPPPGDHWSQRLTGPTAAID